MSAPTPHRRDRDALVHAMIGSPRGLPPVESIDLDAFWTRFDATAPWHLTAGMRAATVAIATVLPRAMGHRRGLAALSPERAEDVVARAEANPVLGPLAEVAKTVACFAYFADDRVQAAVRGPE